MFNIWLHNLCECVEYQHFVLFLSNHIALQNVYLVHQTYTSRMYTSEKKEKYVHALIVTVAAMSGALGYRLYVYNMPFKQVFKHGYVSKDEQR